MMASGFSAAARRALLVLVATALPAAAGAAPIVVYVAPDNTYQNSANDPCVFYGPGNCAPDPDGWPTPAGPTNGGFSLTQTYAGDDLEQWLTTVGSAFVLGLDVNQGNTVQTLSAFSITFFSGVNSIGSYVLGAPLAVPAVSNGVGYADYLLAAGCAGTETNNEPNIDACSNYLPFLVPDGTDSIVLNITYAGPNDGPDKVFAISQESGDDNDDDPSEVPEPASVMLLGLGGAAMAVRRFRTSRR